MGERQHLSRGLRRRASRPGSTFHVCSLSRHRRQSVAAWHPRRDIGLIGIFLPGVLILLGTLPFWDDFMKRTGAQAMMRGVNAAVVGLLGAALYNPVWTSSVNTPGDFGVALVGFALLAVWRAPPLLVVVVSAIGGVALALANS